MFAPDGVSDFDGATGPPSDGVLPLLAGDYYREPDDVFRGVALCTSPSGTSGFDYFAKNFADELYWHDEAPGKVEPYVAFGAGVSQLTAEEFVASDLVPKLPTDTQFRLGLTAVVVGGEAAYETANRLLDFFRGEKDTFVSKVNRRKFTIKVTTFFAGGLACELKVYMYARGRGETAVEFQRRDGDVVAFNDLFRRARSCLRRVARSQRSESRQCEQDLELPPPQDADLLTPLFEMASSVNSTRLRAEAAASIAAAVASEGGGGWVSAELRDPEAAAVLRQLRCANELAVRHPVSHLSGGAFDLCGAMDVPELILGRA